MPRFVRPSVCLSQGAAALGYSHRRPLEMCGLRTSPQTDVDPPRVELPLPGGISSRRPGAITCKIKIFLGPRQLSNLLRLQDYKTAATTANIVVKISSR